MLATACYNFFFLPPLYTFAIADPENWVALAAFLVTSVVVSRLVVAARVEAARAEQRRREAERLAAERERLLAERAHLQALRESDELKTSLLRAVSHDLTTPLTAIALHTEALRRQPRPTPELQEAAVADRRRDRAPAAAHRQPAGDGAARSGPSASRAPSRRRRPTSSAPCARTCPLVFARGR